VTGDGTQGAHRLKECRRALEARSTYPLGFTVNPKSHPPESNRRPTDYESVALPTELGWRTNEVGYLAARHGHRKAFCVHGAYMVQALRPRSTAAAMAAKAAAFAASCVIT
jgi:hypothetical protein